MILKNSRPIIGFDDRYFSLGGIVLNTHTVMAIYYTGAFLEVDFSSYAIKWIGELLCIVILWLVIRELYLALIKWKSGIKNLKFRFMVFPLFLVAYLPICVAYLEFVQPYFDWDYPQFQEPEPIVQLMVGCIILFVDLAFFESLHLFVELKNTKIREERLEKENITSQLANLRNQISPHFLFNSLNTLIYLIDEDKEKSKEFVHKLSFIYKSILGASEDELVSIKKEMEYVKAYTELLQQRFGNNLKFDFNIDSEDAHKKIVPLALQVGIENAIKHNVVSKNHPLNIDIRTLNGFLIVKNNLQKRSIGNVQKNRGIGLKNISNRYDLISDQKVLIESSTTDFTLKLPILDD